MPHSQQEFISEALEYLGLTKGALAIKLNTSEYTINSWMLPVHKPGHAKLSEFIQEKISALVQEKKSANFFQIHAATFDRTAPGMYCDKYQFDFPTLYRATSDEGSTYTLSDQLDASQPTPQFEAISHLEAGKDNTWVFINEHSSMNAVLGYWRGISNSNPEAVGARFKLYLFKNHLFSIYHLDKPDNALLNNLIHYQIDDNEFKIAMPALRRQHFEDWTVIVDDAGHIRVKSEIWNR